MSDFREAVESIAKSNQEPGWLKDLRLDALGRFEKGPDPLRNDDEWRRIDLNKILFSDIEVSKERCAPRRDHERWSPARRAETRDSIVLQGDVPEGVFFGTLSDAACTAPDLVRDPIERSLSRNDRKHESLANALWNGGVFVHVPENINVRFPLAATLRASGDVPSGSGKRSSFFPKILIVLEENSSLTMIVEETTAPGWSGWLNGLIEVVLKPNASLSLLKVQQASHESTSLTSFYSTLERDSSINIMSLNVGSALSKSNWNAEALGEGSSIRMFGLVKGEGTQHFDQTVFVSHRVPRTQSNVLFKSALKDKARSMFSGLIHVHKEAQKTDAYQANRNLLLSKQARADTIPKLEIEADDVKCGHGAAVSSIDPDQLYYIMSRGLTRQEAIAMIIEGFYEDVLNLWLENINVDPGLKQEAQTDLAGWAREILFGYDVKAIPVSNNG